MLSGSFGLDLVCMHSDDHRVMTTDVGGARVGVVTSVPFFLVTQLRGQLRSLQKRGIYVLAITAIGPELAQIMWGKRLKHVAVDIRRRPAPWRDVLALIKMVAIFRRHKLHVVHSTTPKAGLLTAIAAWLARVPVRLHTFTGQQWVTMSGPLRWVSRWSDRMIARLNTRVYADSPSQRQFLIDERIVPADRIGIIGAGSLAGVDMRRFSRDRFTVAQREKLRIKLGVAPEAVIVTFIGRITGDKGIHELLGAISSLRDQGHRVDLVLIGPMDSALETSRSERADTIGTRLWRLKYIHAVGYTDVPEHYLTITDILCLPSYREGFGTVVIEAAAMGVPTVGTRITGLSDAVIDEVTGLLVPPRDADALAVALRRLIADPVLRRRLGEAAHKRCAEQFDSGIANRKLVEEYARLLSAARLSGDV